jgi:hypothetical protein
VVVKHKRGFADETAWWDRPKARLRWRNRDTPVAAPMVRRETLNKYKAIPRTVQEVLPAKANGLLCPLAHGPQSWHQCGMPKRSTKRQPAPDATVAPSNILQAVFGAETGNPPIVTERKPLKKAPVKLSPKKKGAPAKKAAAKRRGK